MDHAGKVVGDKVACCRAECPHGKKLSDDYERSGLNYVGNNDVQRL